MDAGLNIPTPSEVTPARVEEPLPVIGSMNTPAPTEVTP
jgi:hypothetical protein